MFDFRGLAKIEPGTGVGDLKKGALTALQRALDFAGYPAGLPDGLVGPKTRNALAELKVRIEDGFPDRVTQAVVDALTRGIEDLNKLLAAPASNTEQVQDGIEDVCKFLGLGLKTQIAYVLATVDWETAHTFRPVKEAFWLSENWRKNNLRYYPYYGRGYVQLTWRNNYEFYGNVLGVDLEEDQDLALRHDVALFVLVHGFLTGTFTTRKLTEFINADTTNYKGARRCINGTDKAEEIEELAKAFFDEL